MTRAESHADLIDPSEPTTSGHSAPSQADGPATVVSGEAPPLPQQPQAPVIDIDGGSADDQSAAAPQPTARTSDPAAPVGAVAGTEDATPLVWHVAVAEDQFLQLDDVVTTGRTLPDGTRVSTCGVVTQVTGRHEGATFASDTFLVQSGSLPARAQEVAEVMTTRVEPELFVPPRPVSRCSGHRARTGTVPCISTR